MRTRHRAVVLGTAGVIVGSTGAAVAPVITHPGVRSHVVTVAPAAVVQRPPEPASRAEFRPPLHPVALPTRTTPLTRPATRHASRDVTPPVTPSRDAAASGEVLDVTAYCDTAGTPNAAGHVPRIGEAAGNYWPLGTELNIEGYGAVYVEDRYGAATQLDIYMGSDTGCEQRALAFGRKHLRVTVLSAAAGAASR